MAVRVPTPHDQGIVWHYLCANCWGDLYSRYVDEKDASGFHLKEINCTTDGCPCRGFVSKQFVENFEAIARIERRKAYDDLKDILPWVRQLGPERNPTYPWDPETQSFLIPEGRRKKLVIEGLDF
jgi:hypothetical protein